jgi:transglutaminase-like putative cysteine protease
MLAWAVALAWLARRQLGKDEAQIIAEATLRLNPEAHFYAVEAGGTQIGYASLTVDTTEVGFRLAEVMALDIPEQDSIRRVTRRTTVELSRSLRLRRFLRTVTGGGLYEELGGTIEGDSILRLHQRDARDSTAVEWSLPLPGDVVLPEVLPYRLAFSQRLEVGRSVNANVFDLNTGTIDRVEFRATAESTFVVADSAVERRPSHRWVPVTYDTVQAFRIEHTALGSPTVTWVDRHGGLVSTEAALGVRLQRSAFELVTLNYRGALEAGGLGALRAVPGMENLLDAGLRPSPGTTPESLDVTGASVERFLLPRVAWLEGGRQRASGNRLEIRPRAEAPAAEGRPDHSEYLDPPPTMDAAVAARARAIVAGTRDPKEMVRRLTAWTARSIRITTDPSAPTLPGHVLAAGEAGAEGHARLLVDMARALDLTARPVSGLAFVRGRPYGHAWAEVWLDGWVAVDPTFGTVPAPTSLVRAQVGGTGRAIDLVPLLGSARFAAGSPVTSP